MNEKEKLIQKKNYAEMVKRVSPNSPVLLDCLKAFVSGGFICSVGQIMRNYLINIGMNEEQTGLTVSLIFIAITVLLTGLGVFSKIGRFCGAGTVVPITGFANSVASPAIEFKKEGLVFGLGANMFQVAGPVIVYGTITSVVVGLIYFVFKQVIL